MNILTRQQHAMLDVLVVVIFAIGPTVFGLEGVARTLSYALAAVHLAMSLVTAGLPGAPGRLIPLPLHGLIEAVVGVGLGLVGWLGFDGNEQGFFLVMAAVILFVFGLTSYLCEEG